VYLTRQVHTSEQTGFIGVEIEPTRIYQIDDSRAFLQSAGLDVDLVAREVDGRFMGAFVRGTKPLTTNH